MLASRLLLYGWLLGRCNSFKLFSAADLWKANHEKFSPALHSITPQSDEADTNFIRELGGYERLLSRITPNTDKVLQQSIFCKITTLQLRKRHDSILLSCVIELCSTYIFTGFADKLDFT